MSKRVAIVTGGNKGIGLAIVETLYNHLKDERVDIYLTSRNEELGRQALHELEKKNVKACYHQLDICDDASIDRLASFLKEKYDGLDILVNNAGIAYKGNSTAPQSEQAEVTMRTNFFATLNVCNKLFPLLRPHARVVNLSSFVAPMALHKCSNEWQEKFTKPTTMDDLVAQMTKCVEDTKAGTYIENGFPPSSYATSKLGDTVMTILQQRDFDKDSREDLIVNAADPGWVDTDMTSHKGPLSVLEGADTPSYLALLPANVDGPKGQQVFKRKVVAWK